jgi:protein-S-isoprenylcysteine O-methyltransferase Ste14
MPHARLRDWAAANAQLLLKLAAAGFYAILVVRIVLRIADDGDALLLKAMLVTESFTLLLIVASRPAKDQAITVRAVVLTLIPSAILPLCQLSNGVELLPAPLPFILVILSMMLQLHAKATLWRGFGLLPANRGIVQRGPYEIVRHPIYLSYLLQHLGLILGMFHWWNLAVFAAANAAQWLRLLEEEKLLAQDMGYRRYMDRVRCRLIPGVL